MVGKKQQTPNRRRASVHGIAIGARIATSVVMSEAVAHTIKQMHGGMHLTLGIFPSFAADSVNLAPGKDWHRANDRGTQSSGRTQPHSVCYELRRARMRAIIPAYLSKELKPQAEASGIEIKVNQRGTGAIRSPTRSGYASGVCHESERRSSIPSW